MYSAAADFEPTKVVKYDVFLTLDSSYSYIFHSVSGPVKVSPLGFRSSLRVAESTSLFDDRRQNV